MAIALLLPVFVHAGPAIELQIFTPGEGVTAPVVTTQIKPEYPLSALAAGTQGVVRLECVVRADGTVGEIRVTRSVEPAIDGAAAAALREWIFRPGTSGGKPVAVRIGVEIPVAVPAKGPRLGSPEIVATGPGVTSPRLRKQVTPQYPIEAKQDGLQGTVTMDCVVLTDGTVGDVRVTRGLNVMLDFEAIKTLHQWRFHPAQKSGRPVPVQIIVEMSFTLR